MSLEHSRQTCLVHQQTGTAHHAQQTDLTNRLHPTCGTNKEKNNKGKTRGRHPSANKKRQPQQTSVMKKLDYTSRFVRVISTLSPNHNRHITQQVTVVDIMWLSQHRYLNTPPQNGCREMSRFVHKACDHHAPILRYLHHRRSAIFPSLRASGSNNSAQCSSTPETFAVSSQGNE